MDLMMTRREFVKTGAASAAGLALFRDFWGPHSFKAESMDMQSYYAQFGANERTIQKVLDEALAQGGDYCDIFFQHKIVNDLTLEDKIVSSAGSILDRGVGIRVIKGDQTGYSFTEEITPEAMKSAAKAAASIASSTAKVKPLGLEFRNCNHNYYKVEIPWGDVDVKRKVGCLQTLNDEVFAADKRVIKCLVKYYDESNSVLVANSIGSVTCDFQPSATIFITCSAEQNGRREEAWVGYSKRLGGEFLSQTQIRSLAKEAVEKTTELFDSVRIPGGDMPVVLAAGDMGILLHEAIGHGMEADFNRKGTSIFSDKIGKPVAEKFVSIIDDGTCEHFRGSINIDDEGNTAERTVLVRDGVLQGYMHDYISCRHYNAAPTGNGRRETFRFAPMPRMRNTYMMPGPHTPEEIIKSVKYGLYAQRVSNGEVRIGAGDFTFYVKAGRLIEDGKLTKVVKDVNIIGNGPEVLKNMCMVGNDLKISSLPFTCGKNDQRAPVSCGMPTIKITKMTVGAT